MRNKVRYTCAGCGVIIERYPSQIAGKNRVYHSVDCKNQNPVRWYERPPREELEDIYSSCRSFSEVADIYRTSYSTVQKWMKDYGIRPHRWAAEKRVTRTGYVVVRPEEVGGEWRLEHRVIWEQTYGPIPPGATIHHINKDRTDNRLENLELWEGNHPPGRRHGDPHCATCTCYEHRHR